MTHFKKFAMLCIAFLMTASFGLVGCDALFGKTSSSEKEASSEQTSEASSEQTSEVVSEEPEASEEPETSEEPDTSEEPEEETPVYLFRGENTVSVPAGETVDLQLAVPGLILGTKLGLYWTSENAKVIVSDTVVEGTYATLEFTPVFSLALSTFNGEAEEIVLTIGEAQQEAAAVVVFGENTVEVTADKAFTGVEYTFTAEETAMYTIATEDENCNVSWGTPDYSKSGYVTAGNASEFGLVAGETITLYVGTENYEADTVTFTLTQGGAYDPYVLSVGGNNLKVTDADENGVEYFFTAPESGYYTVNSWSSADPTTATTEEPVTTAISYLWDEETRYVDDTHTLLYIEKDTVLTFTGYVYDENSYFEGACNLDLSIFSVAVADTPYTISFVDGEADVCFFAFFEGTYTFEITEGAYVMGLDETWEFVAVDSVTAYEENSIVYLTIKSDTLTEATITLSLSDEDGDEEEEIPEEIPVVSFGENTVELNDENAGPGIVLVFNATETAMYTLSTTHENCFIYWGTTDYSKFGSAYLDNASTFGLVAGETITVTVSTDNGMADTVTFNFEKGGEYDPYALSVGSNSLKVTENDGANGVEYTFVAPADGNYTLNSWSSADPTTATTEEPVATAISYTINGTTQYVDNGQTLISVKKGDVITFKAYVYDENSYFEGTCNLDLSITPVSLENEQITVTLVDGQATVYLYATQAGDYTFTITEGAYVMGLDNETWELVAVDSVTAYEENSIIYITIQSETLTEVTITVVKAE